MASTGRRKQLLRRLGWITLIGGVAWDLTYHTLLYLAASATFPPIVDVLGSLGHGITLAGLVLLVLSFTVGHK
ncbi:MAG: hypothetical protein WCF84_03730 [Anaerolineae bacterium]